MFISSRCSCGFEHLMERNRALRCSPGLLRASAVISEVARHNLGAEAVIFFLFLCFSQPLAAPALRCACIPSAPSPSPPRCQSSVFAQRRHEVKESCMGCLRACVRLAAAATGVTAMGDGGMGERRVRAAMLEIRTMKALWWVSAVSSTTGHKWHNSARGRETRNSGQGTLLPQKPPP